MNKLWNNLSVEYYAAIKRKKAIFIRGHGVISSIRCFSGKREDKKVYISIVF